ncbi:carboxypeptidase-like regulatory domain-containing protein [Zunongwangia endophytica]|uniref:Carboxypeptidase-like regulatory domain-containing protein n=1 Tax=Zunongwangia endophytica TaxID=1808945 RepID=A0ABV8HAG8_9FLAO|nr:carboxypeptidase-like regulatory domain-containing protein [Zunongwangia endophytica]MDN3593524.1 carboxypeptidase-like regulatory domain-containing protein [Zunongwangia endophytica]
MKAKINTLLGFCFSVWLLTFLMVSPVMAKSLPSENNDPYQSFKGQVINAATEDPIQSAHINVKGTTISTISNSDGEFSLKLPKDMTDALISISALGYQTKELQLDYFKRADVIIAMQESVQELDEVSVYTKGDATGLVRKMMYNRDANYVSDEALMTAFYRETIKKGNRNISLSEAVTELHKQPYLSSKDDDISILKARKSTDYKRLDTVALKLRGGPFNALYIDVMKYPQFLFDVDKLEVYSFTYNKPTKIGARSLHVVDFKQNERDRPWYFGKLFIDSESFTLVKAVYSLNTDNRRVASRMFTSKKPNGVKVHPDNIQYQVDYREKDGKWFYSYGKADLEFVVNWKHKIFNSRYKVHSEMAITEWEKSNIIIAENKDFIKPAIVMVDDIDGFADVNFWGSSNIIEPDKSIQNAIEKIQKKIMD